MGYRVEGEGLRLGVDLPDLGLVVKPGQAVHLQDGAILVEITDVEPTGKYVHGVVRNGGTLGERKVVHIAGLTVHSKHSSMQDMAGGVLATHSMGDS